ncbi:MAG TPA: hypothetical protein VJL84_01335 [Kiloniellales bacterium]|nr:hypothetical protein [Kiloniellales bacterium]
MMSRVLAVLAVVLLAAFFMPWLGPEAGQIAGTSCRGSPPEISGFSVVRCLVTTAIGADGDAVSRSFDDLWYLWLLAAIPLFGILTLFAGLRGAGSTAPYAVIAGGVPVGEAIYLLVVDGTRLFAYFDIGAWLTLVTGVLLVILPFVPRRY